MAGGAASSTAPINKAPDVMPRAIKFRLGLAGDNSPEACGYARILCTFFYHHMRKLAAIHTQVGLRDAPDFSALVAAASIGRPFVSVSPL
jgi:hypothetical protein